MPHYDEHKTKTNLSSSCMGYVTRGMESRENPIERVTRKEYVKLLNVNVIIVKLKLHEGAVQQYQNHRSKYYTSMSTGV